ncbi:unnamed protein product [Heterobilharzia americana]|nr:unnamed protein product [Heterobilharzia americana]
MKLNVNHMGLFISHISDAIYHSYAVLYVSVSVFYESIFFIFMQLRPLLFISLLHSMFLQMQMSVTVDRSNKIGSWYFGGVASALAAACTHPLDLIKVHLQTQQRKEFGMLDMGIRVCKQDGILALYNGLSASVLRQLTYSMTRFGIYETYKQSKSSPLPFGESAIVAMVSGFCGGIVGNPADMVNVRMQNDMKIPEYERRSYKHCIDG